MREISGIKTASFKSLGCRLNQAEMDTLAHRLQARGIRVLPFGQPVDLTVINTCTVTRDADHDSRYAIRQAIRKSPRGRVAVTGCYAQMSPESVRAIEGVDLVLDNREKMKLLDYLPLSESEDESRKTRGKSVSKTRANLKIQDGCDYHCSFCIIPFARGRARSLPFGDIVREAESLVSRGFKEIILTGVNIGTYYSEENGHPRRFVDLVDRLQEVEGLVRLRISSIEPNTVTTSLLRLMSRSNTVCPHLHIPIQSASDEILPAMRRKYRVSHLRQLVERIRCHLPEAGIGTDIIVGFPGEAEEDFEATRRFVETAGFSYLHVFPFSARGGTAAQKLSQRVPQEDIGRRTAIMRELGDQLRALFKSKFRGRKLSVLFEEPEAVDIQTGYSENYIKVQIKSRECLKGQIRVLTIGVAEP